MGFSRPRDEALIGDGAGERRRGFDRVKAIHFRARRIAPGREFAREEQMTGRGAQEIAVDGENDVSVLNLRLHFETRAVRQHDALSDVLASDRFPMQPANLRIGLAKRIKLRGKRRRRRSAR